MSYALKLAGVTLPGGGYPKKKNFVVPDFPVKKGLSGLYVFGGKLSLGLINHADGSRPLEVVGQPQISDLGVTCNAKSAFFETGMLSSAAMTFIVVGRPILAADIAGSGLFASNFSNAVVPSTGDSFGFTPGRLRLFGGTATGPTGNAPQDIEDANVDEWNAFAGRITGDGEKKTFWSRAGVVTQGVDSSAAGRALSAQPLRLGGHYSPTQYLGPITSQMVAIFRSALTDAEILANLAYLSSTYGPAIGVSTL